MKFSGRGRRTLQRSQYERPHFRVTDALLESSQQMPGNAPQPLLPQKPLEVMRRQIGLQKMLLELWGGDPKRKTAILKDSPIRLDLALVNTLWGTSNWKD